MKPINNLRELRGLSDDKSQTENNVDYVLPESSSRDHMLSKALTLSNYMPSHSNIIA